MEYLGESFDSRDCNRTCDNCRNRKEGFEKDMTEEAIRVVNILQGPRQGLNTLLQIAALLKGGNLKKNDQIKTHEAFGVLGEVSKEDIEKMLRKMVYLGIIKEKSVKNFKNIYNTVIDTGSAALDLLQGRIKVTVMCECKKPVIVVSNANQLNVTELDKMKYTPKLEAIERGLELNADQQSELRERIELVLRGVARKTKKNIEDILTSREIEELCRYAPDEHCRAPKEIMDEIKYFKSVAQIKLDSFGFDIDLSEVDLEQLESRGMVDTKQCKKSKNNRRK